MNEPIQPVPDRQPSGRPRIPAPILCVFFALILLAAGFGFYLLKGGSTQDLLSTSGTSAPQSPQSASAPSESPTAPVQPSDPPPAAAPASTPPTASTQPAAAPSGPAAKPKSRGKPPLQDPMARAALALIGTGDPAAESYWYAAINNPNLPAGERQDLIEDLNETGLADPRNPTADDMPIIRNRIQIIEVLGPGAMDKTNADAFAEAYKDLVNLTNKAPK